MVQSSYTQTFLMKKKLFLNAFYLVSFVFLLCTATFIYQHRVDLDKIANKNNTQGPTGNSEMFWEKVSFYLIHNLFFKLKG